MLEHPGVLELTANTRAWGSNVLTITNPNL